MPEMKMITTGDSQHSEIPGVAECSKLVMEIAPRLDQLVSQINTENEASKIACNAMIGALSAVLGRQIAQFVVAAGLDEEQRDHFIKMTAQSVSENAKVRLPHLLKEFERFLHSGGGGTIQ